MENVKNGLAELKPDSGKTELADLTIREEVQNIKEAVVEVCESCLGEKVDELRANIENISEDVQSWKVPEKDTYVETLEAMTKQVSEVQEEWANVSSTMKAQRDRLETLLESFPGVIETSSIRALALRVTQLENLVSRMVQAADARTTIVATRRQFVISIVALGVTVVLWVLFIGLNFFR